MPGTTDPFELAVRTVVGQQVSVAAARTVTARLVARLGEPLASPLGPVTRRFPTPEALRDADPAALGMPEARGRALVALADAVERGTLPLDRSAPPDDTRCALRALPGVGPWTASLVALRGRGDPDEFLPTDLGVRAALRSLGRPDGPADAARLAEAWRPWRSTALLHLWTHLDDPDPPPPRSRP